VAEYADRQRGMSHLAILRDVSSEMADKVAGVRTGFFGIVRLLNRATNGGPNARFPLGGGSLDLCYGVIRIRFRLSLLCLRPAGGGV
jgi:hypothetical protein